MFGTKRKRLLYLVSVVILLIIGIVLILFEHRTVPYKHDTGFIFGTVYHIQYQSDSDLNNEIIARLNSVDSSLSIFNKSSIISKVNRNENVLPDKMFLHVFRLAENVANETGGAFDITVAPMVNAWGFGFKKGIVPTSRAIDSLRAFVGYDKVSIVNNQVKKADRRLMLDCNGIAKGYGCDAVADLLRSKGIRNFLIEIGGEIVASGINEGRLPWKVGVAQVVDDPKYTNTHIQTVLNITDKGMATSGNYRNYYYKNGKKYAHTINPKTGYPAQSGVLSATVLADDCATADAYATAFMVLGLNGTKQILERHHELTAYIIYSGNNGQDRVWLSTQLKDKISNDN